MTDESTAGGLMSCNLYGLGLEGLTDAVVATGGEAYRGRQVANWVYRHGVLDFDAMLNLPVALRVRLKERYVIAIPAVVAHERSSDGTEKLLFDSDGRFEAVLMRDADRRTVCLSSQVGCALDCKFCATARLGFGRNLTVAEMLGQIAAAWRLLPPGEKITNVVFMGMGEPLHNLDAVAMTCALSSADWGMAISHKKTTVSTVGLAPRMREFAERDVRANLAISLTAANDELRSRLMPVNAKYPLAELKRACIDVAETTGRRVTFEYVLLGGVNDSLRHAAELVAFIHGIPCKINLIRFHPHPGSEFARPSEAAVEAFRDYLYPRAPAVTVRKSFGVDIDAACGQLAGRGAG